MKFFFPDSQDFVDESFDFESETRSELRVRQRDDRYPHEIFSVPPYDGILVSKAVVDGLEAAQGNTALRSGIVFSARSEGILPAREYDSRNDGRLWRLHVRSGGAAPYTAAEVADFYASSGFDYGLSVDHVILGYRADWISTSKGSTWFLLTGERGRRLRLNLLSSFWTTAGPTSAASRLSELPKGGARNPMRTRSRFFKNWVTAISLLEDSSRSRRGTSSPVSRLPVRYGNQRRSFICWVSPAAKTFRLFGDFGVVSFDSTSPLRKAFKDDRNNYYTLHGTYSAIRVPQVDANPELLRRIVAGQVSQEEARVCEQQCLIALSRFDRGEGTLEDAMSALRAYELVFDGSTDRSNVYRRVLEDRPWKACPCEVCRRLGIHVMIFRGAERNRRRGFHNIFVFNQQLQGHLEQEVECVS